NQQPTPHHNQGENTGSTCSQQNNGSQRYGGHSGRETPGPIPNPEVKPASANGTAPDRMWESRTPPNNLSFRGHREVAPECISGTFPDTCCASSGLVVWDRFASPAPLRAPVVHRGRPRRPAPSVASRWLALEEVMRMSARESQ